MADGPKGVHQPWNELLAVFFTAPMLPLTLAGFDVLSHCGTLIPAWPVPE